MASRTKKTGMRMTEDLRASTTEISEQTQRMESMLDYIGKPSFASSRELETPDFLGTHTIMLYGRSSPSHFPGTFRCPCSRVGSGSQGERGPRDAEHRLSEFHGAAGILVWYWGNK